MWPTLTSKSDRGGTFAQNWIIFLAKIKNKGLNWKNCQNIMGFYVICSKLKVKLKQLICLKLKPHTAPLFSFYSKKGKRSEANGLFDSSESTNKITTSTAVGATTTDLIQNLVYHSVSCLSSISNRRFDLNLVSHNFFRSYL